MIDLGGTGVIELAQLILLPGVSNMGISRKNNLEVAVLTFSSQVTDKGGRAESRPGTQS